MARLGFVVSQIRQIEEARQKRLEQQPETGPHAMVRLLARPLLVAAARRSGSTTSTEAGRIAEPHHLWDGLGGGGSSLERTRL
jgi:hypothetical protein